MWLFFIVAVRFSIPTSNAQGLGATFLPRHLTEVLKVLLNCFSGGQCCRSELMGGCPWGLLAICELIWESLRGEKINRIEKEMEIILAKVTALGKLPIIIKLQIYRS